MAGHSAAPGRSVTSRALGILDTFGSETPRLSLSDIAERSGTPLTTAHRPQWTPRDYESLAREGFAKNAVAYRCVRMIAEAAAR